MILPVGMFLTLAISPVLRTPSLGQSCGWITVISLCLYSVIYIGNEHCHIDMSLNIVYVIPIRGGWLHRLLLSVSSVEKRLDFKLFLGCRSSLSCMSLTITHFSQVDHQVEGGRFEVWRHFTSRFLLTSSLSCGEGGAKDHKYLVDSE